MEKQTAYFKPNTRIRDFIPLPRFIFSEDLSNSARIIYGYLVARTMLSKSEARRGNWTDGDGNIFIQYPIHKLAEESKMGTSTVKSAMKELKKLDLIETKRSGFNRPNRIYVKYIRDLVAETPEGQKMTFRKGENCPSEGQDSTRLEGQNLAPIYTDNSKQMNDTSRNHKYNSIHNFDERAYSDKFWKDLEEKLFDD